MSDPTQYLASRQQGPDPIDPGLHIHRIAIDPCDRWDSDAIATRNIRVGRTAALTMLTIAVIMVVACACIIVFH